MQGYKQCVEDMQKHVRSCDANDDVIRMIDSVLSRMKEGTEKKTKNEKRLQIQDNSTWPSSLLFPSDWTPPQTPEPITINQQQISCQQRMNHQQITTNVWDNGKAMREAENGHKPRTRFSEAWKIVNKKLFKNHNFQIPLVVETNVFGYEYDAYLDKLPKNIPDDNCQDPSYNGDINTELDQSGSNQFWRPWRWWQLWRWIKKTRQRTCYNWRKNKMFCTILCL